MKCLELAGKPSFARVPHASIRRGRASPRKRPGRACTSLVVGMSRGVAGSLGIRLLLLLAGSSVASAAVAQSISSDGSLSVLRARGAEGCPEASTLRRLVVQHLGRDPWDFGSPAVTVTIAPRDGTLTAWIVFADIEGSPSGLREIASSKGCDSLVSDLALVLSVALDHGSRRVLYPGVAAPHQPEPIGRAPEVWLGVAALLAVDEAPLPSWGAQLRSEVRWTKILMALAAGGTWSGETATAETGGSFGLTRLRIDLAGCYRLGRSGLRDGQWVLQLGGGHRPAGCSRGEVPGGRTAVRSVCHRRFAGWPGQRGSTGFRARRWHSPLDHSTARRGPFIGDTGASVTIPGRCTQ
jgi:hypothetical protein